MMYVMCAQPSEVVNLPKRLQAVAGKLRERSFDHKMCCHILMLVINLGSNSVYRIDLYVQNFAERSKR